MSKPNYSDADAARYYEDPTRLEPAGPPLRRPSTGRRLSSHVPIRFEAKTISRVKSLADEDGVGVSSWIRHLVEREVERRISARNSTVLSAKVSATDVVQVSRPATMTVNENEKNVELVA